jgi:cytochrome c peroxidase
MGIFTSIHCPITVLSFSVSLLTLAINPLFAGQDTIQPDRLGLPPVGQSPSKQHLAVGKRLFFDMRLSGNGSVSCGTCHQPDKAFADGKPVAEGIKSQKGTRNTPSIINSAFLTSFFWDGRRTSLVDQAKDPFVNPVEHGLASHDELVQIVGQDPDYQKAFQTVSGKEHPIALEQVAEAIAAYVGSLVSGNSAFDRYYYGRDRSALSSEARLGLELFRGKARCDTCHVIGTDGAIFTDGQFHRLGIGSARIEEKLGQLTTAAIEQSQQGLDHRILGDPDMAELGRFLVTHDPKDIGKFKTPSLRNVALTAPYMHDGSVPTLEAAVDRELYYRSFESARPILLSPREKAALVEFLRALSSRPLSPDIR